MAAEMVRLGGAAAAQVSLDADERHEALGRQRERGARPPRCIVARGAAPRRGTRTTMKPDVHEVFDSMAVPGLRRSAGSRSSSGSIYLGHHAQALHSHGRDPGDGVSRKVQRGRAQGRAGGRHAWRTSAGLENIVGGPQRGDRVSERTQSRSNAARREAAQRAAHGGRARASGKTLIAKAIAGEAERCRSTPCPASEFVEIIVGVGAARACATCIQTRSGSTRRVSSSWTRSTRSARSARRRGTRGTEEHEPDAEPAVDRDGRVHPGHRVSCSWARRTAPTSSTRR